MAGKRPAVCTLTVASNKKPTKETRFEAEAWLIEVMATPGIELDDPIYDTCPQVVKNIEHLD